MPTAAHRRSAFAIFDPAYSAREPYPPAPLLPRWLYLRSEYECFLLERMRRDVEEAKLRVGYPGCFHTPFRVIRYRCRTVRGGFTLRIHGRPEEARLDGRPLTLPEPGGDGCIRIQSGPGLLELRIAAPDGSIPALAAETGDWEASADGISYSPAVPGGAPDDTRLPELSVTPVEFAPGRYDAGRELLARVEVHSASRPQFGCGESLSELENHDAAHFEQSLELRESAPGIWTTPQPLAFRYLRVEAGSPVEVVCRAVFAPAQYRGAFAADPELTRIWMHAAYTLRICRYHFLIDGVKRDRLPWVGDLALSLLANAYAFGDPEPVRRTLAVLGRAGIREQHLNGIVDYSLWFLICHDLYQLYWADAAFLELQRGELTDHIEVLLARSEETGFLPSEGSWLFIDWVKFPKESALQILFHWALRAARKLMERLGEQQTAERCAERAGRLKEQLFRTAFDAERGLFFATPGEPASGFFRHPNFLAIPAGLLSEEQQRLVVAALLGDELPPVGTPYMAAVEIWALHRAGASLAGIERIRRIWGGMLKQGASTFFEAYREGAEGEELYSFYGRRFGLSLCHAWSAGPAALLPMLFSGCEPVADGWKKHTPCRELPDGAAVTIPTPSGALAFEAVSSGPEPSSGNDN